MRRIRILAVMFSLATLLLVPIAARAQFSAADTVVKILHAKSGNGITGFVTPVVPSFFNPALGHQIALAALRFRPRYDISHRLPKNGERTTRHE